MHPRKLIIHIGSHKTGTSSIQSSLFGHCGDLEKQGFTLYNYNLDGSLRQNGNADPWICFEPGSHLEARIREGLAQELRALAGNVLISSAHFSWIFDESELHSFHDQLKDDFDEFKIVAYVRRQDQQAVSHYQQGSEFNAVDAARYYDGGCRALPPCRGHFQQYLNYFQKLGMWGNVFGDANMIVRVIDEEFLRDGDIVANFFAAVSLDIKVAAPHQNESRSFEQTKLGHLMNRMKVPGQLRKSLLCYSGGSGKFQPAREDARAFYQHFRQSNKQLNEKYAINGNTCLFNEDFDMYPVESQDTWTEDSANQAILNLLEGVNHLPALDSRDLRFLGKVSRRMVTIDREKSAALSQLIARHGGRNIEPGSDRAEVDQRRTRAGLRNFLSRIRKLF